jgi:hypothetical protein
MLAYVEDVCYYRLALFKEFGRRVWMLTRRLRIHMRITFKRAHARKKAQFPPAPWQEYIEI